MTKLLLAGLALASGGIGCQHHRNREAVPVVSAPLPTVEAPGTPPIPGMASGVSVRPFIPEVGKPDSIIAQGPILMPGGTTGPELLPQPQTQSRAMAKQPGDAAGILPPQDLLKLPEMLAAPKETPKDLVGGPTLLPEPKPVMVIPMPKTAEPSGPTFEPLSQLKPDSFVAAPGIPTPPLTPTIVRAPATGSDTKASPASFSMPLKPGETYGHSTDYRWVAGVLDRHQRGNIWTLRYADFSSDDRWGGKVRLVDADKLRGYQEGDILYIEGELLAPNNASAANDSNAYPPFKVTDVKLVRKGR
jgi:hypothetical protein